MRKLAIASIAALAFGFSLNAQAGYDKTKWGMSLAQVRKLYPGGLAKKRQTGETEYTVVMPIAELSPAVVGFIIGPTDGLNFVMIAFPKQGSEVFETRRFARTTNEESKPIWEVVLAAMESKYGRYVELPNGTLTWVTTDGDMITLQNKPEDASHSTVTVCYGKHKPEPSTKGL